MAPSKPSKGSKETPKETDKGSQKRSASFKPLLAAKIVEVRDTYGKMSAKARGVRIHNGPLELRKALPSRDTTEWVRSAKQPYSTLEALEPPPKPPASSGPPPLWLPTTLKAQAKKKVERHGDKEGKQQKSLADYDETTLFRRPWDTEHHIMVSRMNDEVQSGVREYFDKPKAKEGEGIPRMRERYAMSDRQLKWHDEPGKLGQMRRTLFDNVGPVNLGGCKEQQLPSYWRNVKDWSSFSTPAMPTIALRGKNPPPGQPPPGFDRRTLFQALANTPAAESAAFWRDWAERSVRHVEADVTSPKRARWDDSWQMSWSKGNDEMNWRCREYFSVPDGGTGRSMPSPTSPGVLKHPFAATLQENLAAMNLSDENTP